MDESKTTDEIGKLVRLAEESAIAGERMERARGVARAAWREKTRRRSRRRVLLRVAAVAAMLTVAVVASTLWDGRVEPSIELALVQRLVGEVTLDAGAGETPLLAGGSVPMNAAVSTSAGGMVALRLPAGHSLRIDGGSEVALRDDGTLALVAGALYLESDPDQEDSSVDVLTPFGLVREIGTQFELRLRQRGLRIRTREGAVRLERPGRDHTVAAGTELRVDASGHVETATISTYGIDWDWVSSMAPVPDLRGRSTYVFLNWIARERGWSLAFGDEAALRAAQDAIIEGRLERLDPDEALDAVLQASRLGWRLTDGTLVVSALP